jgi:hypothetical protein
VLIQPATVARWHREGFRECWSRRLRRRPEDRASIHNFAPSFGAWPQRTIWTNPLRGSGSASIPSRLSDLGVPAVRIE